MSKVTINTLDAIRWEAPVEECKGAELCNVGSKEHQNEFPPAPTKDMLGMHIDAFNVHSST